MVNFAPYATQEDQSLVQHETSIYVAIVLGMILYGMQIIVVTTCSYFLYKEHDFRRNFKWFLYIYIIFAIGTVFAFSNVYLWLLAWVLYRGYPGGPAQFWIDDGSFPIYKASISLCGVNSMIVEALLLYRCHVLYNQRWVLILPGLIYITLGVLCALFVIQITNPGNTLLAHGVANFAVPLFSLEAVLNIILCGLLIGRLLHIRHKIKKTLGSNYSKTYSDIAKLIAESALPCGVMSCLVAIFYLTNNDGVQSVLTVYFHVMCMSPMLIILQVSRRSAWSKYTVSDAKISRLEQTMGKRDQVSVLVFAEQGRTHSTIGELGDTSDNISEVKETEFDQRKLESV